METQKFKDSIEAKKSKNKNSFLPAKTKNPKIRAIVQVHLASN